MKNIGNINNTKLLLDKYNLSAKISLGQNFLVDEKVIDKIINTIDINDDIAIIEIGPGLGAISEKLMDKAKKLVSIEIDQNMVKILNDLFSDRDNFELINEDVLKFDLSSLVSKLRKEYKEVYLVANLPYYISSEILLQLFALDNELDLIMIMVQSEFRERLFSKHNTKDYRPITVVCKTFYKQTLSFNISRNVFFPKPKITSSIIQMKRKDSIIKNKREYIDFVELCFTQKRKTLYNNLRNEYSEEFIINIFEKAKIDLKARPAQLDIADYIRLFEVYYEEKIIC